MAVAVVQAGSETAVRTELGPFGSFDVEAAAMTQDPAGTDGQG